MATTRIIPMHQNKGKTIRQCLSDRLDYGKNPDKTQEGQLISAYACDPETADAEFALSKREYFQLTGRRQDSDVIAYQVRQSFRPGEITPEEANRIGYEFAERFLKGNHAFIVCTHTDKQHIHNHIYWNSTSLDCTRKFRNFWGSTMAVRKLSDLICVQHRLSVIENPKPHGISYNRWQGDIEKLSNRDRLCLDMDAALAKKPHDLEGFYSLMEQAGYTVTRGKNITFSHPRQKRNIRMRSLPEEYREDVIREVLAGRRIHNPRKRRSPLAEQKAQLVSSLEAKQNQGRGRSYDLSIQNQITKQQAKALLYYQQHGFTSADDFDAFAESVEAVKQHRDTLSAQITSAEKRLNEIAVLQKHITNYLKTKDIYAGYRASGYSITSQKEIIRDYVRRHPEFVIVKEYADDGYSGVNFERPGFKQMMEDIKAKKIDCVICKDLSRFARNYIDAGRYLEKIFPFMGVRFIAINDNYDSCGEKAQSDALIVPFKNLINDAYCRDISVKIRSQLDIKRKMGDFIGAFAPYGYRKDEANRNRLVVDEEAARTVELIFRLRIQGLCNSAIADRLNSMGVLSPMEYKQAQGFNYSCGFRSNEQAEWSPMLVKRILSNEIYIGTLIQHKSGTPNHKIKKRVEYDRDEWIVIENNHEPIICRSDFDTVQNLMLRDVRTAPKQEKVHLFSGFVFCGDCKHTMVRKTVPSGGKKYHYLVCSTNKAGKGCSPHTFSEDKLKAIVLRVVNDHIELIAQVEQVLDYIASLPEQERRIINYDAQMMALENEIKRYQDLKINLYSDMADGVISREEYKEFHAGYDRRIADRQRQLGKLKDERSQAMENSSGNIEWIEQFKKYRHLTELDRECIVHLIEKILIYDGKRIEVCFRYRDELENALQYIERFEDVLPAEEGVTMLERRNA